MVLKSAEEIDMAALPYMPLWVKEYIADTTHLSCEEHGAYLLLIMAYWQRGEPLPNDDVKLARITRLSPDEWLQCKPTILEFFTTRNGRLIHGKIDRQLSDSEAISARAKAASDKRWAQTKAAKEPPEDKPKTKKKKAAATGRGTRLPADWQPSVEVNEWAAKERPDLNISKVLEEFVDYWKGVSGVKGAKLDWDATFRNWIRRQVATGNRRNITTGAGNENSSGNSNGLGRNDKPSLPERNRRAAEHALKYGTF